MLLLVVAAVDEVIAVGERVAEPEVVGVDLEFGGEEDNLAGTCLESGEEEESSVETDLEQQKNNCYYSVEEVFAEDQCKDFQT